MKDPVLRRVDGLLTRRKVRRARKRFVRDLKLAGLEPDGIDIDNFIFVLKEAGDGTKKRN